LTQYGEAFSWPARDPAWIRKLVVIGLLALLPLVGQMNLLGWTLRCLDNLRAERYELAPANLSHVGRGARLFLVLVACGVALGAVVAGLSALTAHALALAEPAGLVILVAALGLAAVQPPLWLGVAPGLAFERPLETLAAALLLWSGLLIAFLGVFVCGIGVLFTLPYGYAMVAGVLRVYELQLQTPSAAPA
jgi:hypothetical protein